MWHLPASGQPCASSGTSPAAELLSALQQGIVVIKIRGSTTAEPLLPTTELPSLHSSVSVGVMAFNTFTGVLLGTHHCSVSAQGLQAGAAPCHKTFRQPCKNQLLSSQHSQVHEEGAHAGMARAWTESLEHRASSIPWHTAGVSGQHMTAFATLLHSPACLQSG